MRVLFIDVNCKSSSTGKIVYDLYTAVNKGGDTAAICYGRGEKIAEHNIFKFGLDIETYIHALLTRLTGYTGCFSPFSTRRLIRFIKKFKPDVVHIHELHAYFVNIKPLINYLKKNKIKTVMTLHCEFAYTGKCGHSIECEKWKTECNHCPHLHDYPKTLFFDHTRSMFRQKKKLFEDFDNLKVVTPSKWLAERAKQSFLGVRDIFVIPNGIDTEIFSPKDSSHLREKHGIADTEKVVVAVAPDLMSELKGGKFVLETARKLKDEKIRFVMVGLSDPSGEFPENVIPLGKIYDQKELASYYSLADVFLICSKRENLPTTCLEAQCCGSVVCGFDVGGVKETVLEAYKNNCVEYGNTDALCERLLAALESEPSSEKISKESARLYGKQTMFENYLKLYR